MSFKSLLVIGIDAIAPTRLPRLLHDAGCAVTLLAPPHFSVARSRYVDTRLPAPVDLSKLTAVLKEHLLYGPRYDLVVIGDQAVLNEIARHRDEPWLDLCFPVDRRTAAFDLITSKHRFIQACEDAELRVPRSLIASGPADLEKARSTFGLPLMLKLESGFSGSGVRRIDTPRQLDQARLELSNSYPVMVEEFVDGPVGCTEILYHKGQPLCWNSCVGLRHWPTPLAASCLRQTVDHPDIVRIVRTIGEMTGFNGFCGTDWILDRRGGHPLLIEFNPRATPGLHLGYTANVDFARALAGMLRGVPTTQTPSVQDGMGPVSALFPELTFRAIDDRAPLTLLEALRQMPVDDPLLVLAHIRRIITHYLPQSIRSYGRRSRHAHRAP